MLTLLAPANVVAARAATMMDLNCIEVGGLEMT